MTPSEVARRGALPLRPLELAAAVPVGLQARPARDRPGTEHPRAALEAVLLPLVRAGRLHVSFSGGRDSSLLLALTAHLARREGADPPVPVTLRVTGSAVADEADWQELVLAHLGLRDQVVVPVEGELDVVGDLALAVAAERGLLFPPNSHLHVPLLQAASGGTLLTGAGGDEVLTSSARRSARVLAGRLRPGWRDAAVITAGVLAPWAVRRRMRGLVPERPWLSALGQAEYARATTHEWARPHDGWTRELRRFQVSRYVAALLAGTGALAATGGASLVHPLLDPRFLDALAGTGGRVGHGGRTAGMRLLAADLLPEPVLSRTSKGEFGDATWRGASQHHRRDPDVLAAVADDPELRPLVDVGRLRDQWAQDRPHFGTALLLQAAVLATR